MSLLGNELYIFRNKEDPSHQRMFNIVGVFVKDLPVEKMEYEEFHPFKLIFPGNKSRIFYSKT